MKLKIGKNLTYEYSKKRLLYMLCFVMLCIIDQRTKTGTRLDGIIETFRDATGIVLACIIFSHYKLEEFKKWKFPYIVWGILSTIGGVGAFFWGMNRRPFLNDWIVVILDVVFWGYIVIHTFIQVVVEKEYPALNKRFSAAWCIMMLLMIVSRSHYIWPLSYLVMFGCFYLTDFTKEEQSDLLQGSIDGIILAFVLFQGFCCVFRPYDNIRYIGIYDNSNINALYYLAVLACIFTKIIYLTKEDVYKWIRIFYWLAAGVLLSFLFMTIGRIAWITAFLMSLLFLAFLNAVLQKKRFIRNGIILLLCAVIMFPVCFSATRYLPPVFHHPIWFWGEWSEGKVHSWDPWNSEKYVDIDELLETTMKRIVISVENLLEHSPFLIKADAAEIVNEATAEEDAQAQAYAKDAFLVRSTIYHYYFTRLNWRGYPQKEQGFRLTKDFWVYHAHNIFLQYGTDFGIPVMILFIILIVWGCAICGRRGKNKLSPADIAALFFILIPAVFGLFEYSWGVGSLSITMLFISWRQAMRIDA